MCAIYWVTVSEFASDDEFGDGFFDPASDVLVLLKLPHWSGIRNTFVG